MDSISQNRRRENLLPLEDLGYDKSGFNNMLDSRSSRFRSKIRSLKYSLAIKKGSQSAEDPFFSFSLFNEDDRGGGGDLPYFENWRFVAREI